MRVQKNSRWLLGLLIPLCLLTACVESNTKTSSVDSLSKAQQLVRKKVMVEIIIAKDSVFNPHPLYDLSKRFSLDQQNLVQWKNRVVVYADLSNPDDLVDSIKKEYPTDTVQYFAVPFYNFSRKMCKDTATAKEWTNIFLTANLVTDPKLQQEYLNYHKTQFEKWPEVSNGFCNANFQQLLVFKNGRQLMLVISIPKGKTLEELNPMTTKNNPRVDKWNKLMSKYQEGLPGTKKGETWVFLKPLDD
jgi:L-rhamnose mutarotase